MTVSEKLLLIENKLHKKNIADARFDARIIMKLALECSDAEVISRFKEEMPKKAEKKANKLLRKRLTKKPMAYILGSQGFYGMEFKVGKGVLIPRSDTEILVENAVKTYKELNNNDEDDNGVIIDMCTGSGCIALSVAKELPNANVYGVDISKKALKYAKFNKKLNKIENCNIVRSNLFNYFESKKNLDNFKGKVSMIISNPPYIKTKVYQELDDSVKKYEPRLALDAGMYGKDFYKRILFSAKSLLKKGGIIAFEIDGEESYTVDIKEYMEYYNFKDIKVIRDYNGQTRVMIGTLK